MCLHSFTVLIVKSQDFQASDCGNILLFNNVVMVLVF